MPGGARRLWSAALDLEVLKFGISFGVVYGIVKLGLLSDSGILGIR